MLSFSSVFLAETPSEDACEHFFWQALFSHLHGPTILKCGDFSSVIFLFYKYLILYFWLRNSEWNVLLSFLV